MSKKRPWSDWKAGDYYLCADCDSVYHGQQQLCEHLAKHANIKRQARKRICIRNPDREEDLLDYQRLPRRLIPQNYIDDSSQHTTCVDRLSGIEQLTQSKQMNDYYYTYHGLKMSVNKIAMTRRVPPHSFKTTLDIIHDINVLKHTAKELKLPCAKTNLFERIQARLLGSNFKQPPLKTNTKTVITKRKKHKLRPLIEKPQAQNRSDKREMDADEDDDTDNHEQKTQKMEDNHNGKELDYEIIEKKETVKFKFDSSDLQRYLDANSEIIGRLQAIRKEKSFYGVTQEERDLNRQFAENTAKIVQYSTLPQRLLI